MDLGGYKFAGYKCTKGSSMTDAEWALRIHRTRIKAFLDANTSANAGWVFDLTEGELDYEAGDCAIYDLGGDGLNLVSYFRNGTYPNAKYYMIASLFNWTCGSATAPQIKVSNTGPIVMGYYSSSNQYKVVKQTLFHTVSFSPFPEDCLLYSANNYPSNALPLIPIGGWGSYSSSAPNITPSTVQTYFKASSLYIGCAVKGFDIESFTIDGSHFSDSYMLNYARTTIVGFGSLTLSSPNDSANIYGITLNGTDSNWEGFSATWTSSVVNYYQETLNDAFTRYITNDKNNHMYLAYPNKAFFNGSTQVYPYEAVVLTTGASRNSAPFLNTDGITSKGLFNAELLSCNGSYNYSSFTMWGTVANGNYLTAVYKRTGSTSFGEPQATYYVGWDASNPNILDESSWAEFSG